MMEKLQYLTSPSATCPSGWWPWLSDNGATSQGTQRVSLRVMMLQQVKLFP